jgi:hypothetical protein
MTKFEPICEVKDCGEMVKPMESPSRGWMDARLVADRRKKRSGRVLCGRHWEEWRKISGVAALYGD